MNRFKRFLFSIWETLEVVFISVVTVYLIRVFIVQPFLVSGASMEPNFSNGNYLLVDEISYRFREPVRGEVVVFRFPINPELDFIKRIVGLPGERVKNEDGGVRVFHGANDKTGTVLKEDYLPPGMRTPGTFDVELKSDEYFVLGDNRSYSYDSRSWGSVKREFIIGLMRVRVLPFKDFTFSKIPAY